MKERAKNPSDPTRRELDPAGRPVPPRNSVVTPPRTPGRAGGLFIAGIVVILLIIAGLFYVSGPNGGNVPQQAQSQQATPPADTMTTGSTARTSAPQVPATSLPAASSTNSAPTSGPNPK